MKIGRFIEITPQERETKIHRQRMLIDDLEYHVIVAGKKMRIAVGTLKWMEQADHALSVERQREETGNEGA